MHKKIKFLFLAGLATLVFSPFAVKNVAHGAAEIVVEPPEQVEQWFAALGGVNRRKFKALIADDAVIILKDLGIEQTKQEFISALDSWEYATRKANIIYRYQAIEDDSAIVLVCYIFKSNELLNVETYTFSETQITGSVQEPKSDSCAELR